MKDIKILEIMELFDEGEVIPASQMQRPQSALDREMFEDANERFNKAGGGMLVQPSADGSRPGYAKNYAKEEGLTKIQKQKIIDAFPETKFNFDDFKYGVKKYLTPGNTNKDYTKVLRFIKKGFTKEMGKGLSARGTPYKDRGKRLSLKDQEKIKSLFELPEGINNWDFKTYKYGIKPDGKYENFIARINRRLKDKTPWKIAADRGSTKGWMLLQMNRVFENEKKRGIKNLTYQPVYQEINGIKRIIGFKDNTVAGGGNYYYGLNKYAKKNATNITRHGDFNLNQKLVDISKRSFNEPNEVITGLLKQKGFKDKVRLNDLIQYLSGTPGNSKDALLNAVTRHHQSGVKFGSATNDLALTTRVINNTIKGIESRIANNIIKPDDIQVLKNNNVFVRGTDGKLYGAGAKTPIGQFKQIEKGVETAIRSSDFNVKGLSAFMKKLGIKCQLANGINCNMPQAYEKSLNQLSKASYAGDSAAAAKMTNFAKSVRGAGSIVKGVLGPAALAWEVGVGVPLGLFEYAQGKPADEIISSLTYGLAGTDRETKLKEIFPEYGQGDALEKTYKGFLSSFNKLGEIRDPESLRPGKQITMEDVMEKAQPFMKQTVPPSLGFKEFDLDMFRKNIDESRAVEKKLIDQDLERKEQRTTDPFTAYSDDFMAAGGGIAGLSGGIDEGPQIRSMNPDSGGLKGLLNRVKKQ